MMTTTRDMWEDWYQAAEQAMQQREGQKGVLIEVAAQHPLVDGTKPGEEFAARLRKAKDLYYHVLVRGGRVEIYVPGSRHRYNSVADQISLSEAGVNFLRDHGVPTEALHGNDLNQQHKGDKGVYNTADECFVAASYFKDQPDFGALYCVTSPVQILRQSFHYVRAGVLPLFYTAPVAHAYHNPIREFFGSLSYTVTEDPDWQGEDSEFGNKSREERRPQK